MATEINPSTVAVIPAGGVEYALAEAAVDIDEFIAGLEAMKEDGATHVVIPSGNYRGAQWVRVGSDFGWADE